MTDRPISNIERKFQRQLGFLSRSAAAFDSGFEDEDVRLATSVRVIFHQTTTSHSIYTQLSLTNKMLDSSAGLALGNLVGEMTLVQTGMGSPTGPRFIAPFSNSFRRNWIPFENWWNQIVIKTANGAQFSRRSLVMQLANKEGGAHVDPKINLDYEEIKEDSLGVRFSSNDLDVERNDVFSVSMRQISHEVLETFLPNYRKDRPVSEFSAIVGKMSLSVAAHPLATKLSRNSACPCESGLKFKRCHGFR